MRTMLMSFLENDWPEIGCREWTGAIGKGGYGNVKYKGRYMNAHRAAWVALRGEIPLGFGVCRSCDNRKCVNINHLFLGTRRENMLDASRKGRIVIWDRSGERNPRAKLTSEIVDNIRKIYGSGLITQREIGEKYGINQGRVSSIVRRITWK